MVSNKRLANPFYVDRKMYLPYFSRSILFVKKIFRCFKSHLGSTTTHLHRSLSFAKSTPFSISSSSYVIFMLTLSFHLCLRRPLGLFMFTFHSVILPIIFSNLHTCSAQLNLLLFKIPILVTSSYRYQIPSLSLYRIFLQR